MADLNLDGVHSKLQRADTHLQTLQAEIAAFFDREPYGFRQELDREAGTYRLCVDGVREDPPLLWSVIVGEFVYDLRSGLDQLACQLALVSGGKCDRTQFPIFTAEPISGQPLAAWRRMTAGMSEPILKEVRRVQPYTAGDAAKETALAILNALSNEDKHRLPFARVSAVARHEQGTIGLIVVNDIEVLDSEITTGVPLKDGDQVARATISAGPNTEVSFKGPIPMDIAFGVGPHHVPMQGLVEIREATQKVAARLAAIAIGGTQNVHDPDADAHQERPKVP